MCEQESEEALVHARHIITESAGVFEAQGGDGAVAAKRLRAVAQLGGGIDVRGASVMALARRSFDQGRYEQAEQLFKEVGRLDEDSSRAIVPLMHLCQTYLASGVAASTFASVCLDDLASRFGSILLPAEVPSPRGDPSASLTEGSTVAEWVDRQRARPVQSASAAASPAEPLPAETVSNAPRGLPGETAWSIKWNSDTMRELFGLANMDSRRAPPKPRIVRFSGQLPGESSDSVLLIDGTDVLYSLSADDGRLLWRTALRPLEVFDDRYDLPVQAIVAQARTAFVV